MSDNASTKSIAAEPAPMSGDVMPVETYADRLMDDLFTEFDHSLKSGSSLPTEPPPSDYVSLKSLSIPAISLPSIVKLPQPATDEESQTVETKAVRTDEKSSDSNQWLDKWLIGAACGSLLIMLALWLGIRTQSQQSAQTAILPNPVTSVAPSPASESDTQFIKYMLRSLERIEKQPAQTQSATQANAASGTPAQNVINLPPIPVSLNLADANSLAQSLNRLAGALEKAGVQTATAPTTAKPSAAAPAQTPKPTAKPSAAAPAQTPKASPTAQATPSQAAVGATSRSVAIAIPGAPTPPAVATPKPPASTPQPTAETSTETPAAPTTQTPQTSSETPVQPATTPTTESALPQLTPQPTGDVHTLVGILELGDRSAALFEVNGVARRVNEGESIGGSGWSLVEVANQEAIIRRNGEVRSIYVGQKF